MNNEKATGLGKVLARLIVTDDKTLMKESDWVFDPSADTEVQEFYNVIDEVRVAEVIRRFLIDQKEVQIH